MDAQTGGAQAPEAPLHGAPIIDAIKRAGVSHVVAVPDIVTSAALLSPIASDPALTLIRTCKEDECIAIAAALSYAGKRAVVLVQHTGLLYAMNAIRSVAVEYRHPICMIVGLLNHESDAPARESHNYGPRILPPILDAMGIPHHQINTDQDIVKIPAAIELAYAEPFPVAMLIARTPAP